MTYNLKNTMLKIQRETPERERENKRRQDPTDPAQTLRYYRHHRGGSGTKKDGWRGRSTEERWMVRTKHRATPLQTATKHPQKAEKETGDSGWKTQRPRDGKSKMRCRDRNRGLDMKRLRLSCKDMGPRQPKGIGDGHG